MINVANLTDHIRHQMGGEIPAAVARGITTANVKGVPIINEAGRAIYSMHPWSFRTREPATISFVADQATYDLPANFTEPYHIELDDSLYGCFEWVSLKKLASLEENPHLFTLDRYWGATVAQDPASTGAAFNDLSLRLAPTPGSAVTDALKIWYLADWTDLADSGSSAHVPYLPEWMEGPFISLVRQIARGYLTDDPLERIEAWKNSDPVKALMEKDQMMSGDGAYRTGGMVPTYGRYPTITTPVSEPP